ncbi:MAG: tRNA pseudouridine(13) synthase TruD, partial [bacterium]
MITYKNGIVKYLPTDFVVTEKIIPNFQKGNKYSLFVLEKNNVSLFNCLMRLSKILKIPISNFHFFGEKDKYALTKQVIYTQKLKFIEKEILLDNFKLIYLFDVQDINKNLMIGNKFFITVRKIKNQQLIQEKIEKIKNKSLQIPNYYDIQRF